MLPEAAALDDPPGRPESVQDAVAGARAVAGLLTELAGSVETARAPSWEGDDARALTRRCAVVSSVSADAADALLRGAGRLSQHAELWHGTRARLAALRGEQELDRAAVSRRVALPLDPSDPFAASVDDALAALAAAEGRRAAEHRRLLAVLEDDVADTARVLRACCVVVGAVGGRGRVGREVAHLAPLLPGWAAREVTARGHGLGEVLRYGDPRGSEASAMALVELAGDAAFASALLSSLGVAGLRQLLLDLDHVELGEGSAVARVLAAALGAAAALPAADGRVQDVLSARYVDPYDAARLPDQVARGLAVVALTGARYGQPPGPRTIAAWARHVALREAARGPVADRLGFLADDTAAGDPLHGLTVTLASHGDGAAAAELLVDRRVWTHLLARPWQDGGDALVAVVASLSEAAGRPARTALHAGLEALGTGLEDGRPDGWTVDRRIATAVRPGLAEAVSTHVGAITGLLADVADRCPAAEELAALRGLGYLTIDAGATEALMRGLQAWAGRLPPRPLTAGGAAVLVAVPSAFLAVRHYGQRLAYSLGTHDRQAEAERARRRWDVSVGLPVDILMNVAGKRVPLAEPLVGALEISAQRWADADGQFDIGEDVGTRFTGADAAAWATAGAEGSREDGLRHIARAAADVYQRAGSALGEPVIATPPEQKGLWQAVMEDVVEQEWLRHARKKARAAPSGGDPDSD